MTFTAPFYDWTGLYLGLHGGGGWSKATAKDPAGANFAPPGTGVDVSGNGLLGGAQAGFNYQTGRWVFGIEGDFSYTDIHGKTTSTFVVPNVTLGSRLNWLATVTGRIGLAAWDRTLIYAKAGGAFGGLSFSAAPPVGVFDGKNTQAGWTVGIGAEYALWNNWSVKAEYDYLDLGTRTVTARSPAGAPLLADQKVTEQMIKFGANYKFNWR